MKRLAIFDLDGTLLNTLGDLAGAGNRVLAGEGFPTHPVEAFRYFVGDGIYKLVERMTPENRREPVLLARLKAAFDADYAAHSEDLTAPYPGVVEVLDALNAQGVTCVVLSNKPHAFTAALCPRYFGSRIAVAHGQREGYPCKPDGALVAELLGLTGVPAADCVYIGDSGVDMQTGKNGGVYAVGALWGFRTREELEQAGADALAESPGDLLKFFE